jgi:hypothetical protein
VNSIQPLVLTMGIVLIALSVSEYWSAEVKALVG